MRTIRCFVLLAALGSLLAAAGMKVVPASHAAPQDATSLSTKGKASPELFIQMAMFAEQSGRPDQAEENYLKALKVSPKHIGALLGYAGFKDRQRSPREAQDLYEKAVKNHPKEAAVYNDFALFYARQRKYAEAIAQYEKAIQLQPSRPRYRNNIAIVLVETGAYDKALTHLAATGRESDAYYNMGYLLSKKGEMAAAKPYFAKALELEPSRTDALTWLEHISNVQAAQAALAASESSRPAARPPVEPPQAASRRDGVDSPRTARRIVPRDDAESNEPAAPPRGVRRSLPPAPEPPPIERRLPSERTMPGMRAAPEPAHDSGLMPLPATQGQPASERTLSPEPNAAPPRRPASSGIRRLPPPGTEQGVEVPAAPARRRSPAAGASERRPGPVDSTPKSDRAPSAAPAESGEPAPLPPDVPVPAEPSRAKPARLPPVSNLMEPPLPPATRSGTRLVSY